MQTEFMSKYASAWVSAQEGEKASQVFDYQGGELAPNCTCLPTFGDRLAVEITDTHLNTQRKLKLFRDLRIGAVEVVIPDDWHVENQTTITAWELKQLRQRISGFWRSEISVKLIYAQIFIRPAIPVADAGQLGNP